MLALTLACGKDDDPDDLPDALEGSFHATCNWDGTCDPDIRYFRFEGEDYDLRLAFASDILVDADLASLRQHLLLGEAEFADGVIPESSDAVVCGQEVPSAHLEDFSDGRLRGSIEGSVRRCRVVEGDILDDTGVEPYPFVIHFDLGFDPNEEPPKP
ncbi:hypothetical protein OV203_49865 [Nannocystis sp. ILAH1]|uniref:hypothetical protein n=1 Tax=unclassified Nannocystis TaxID=2627009 RepID=UPI00226EF4BF|nr:MULTISPECIES: hypothetical protein [unclassified Nannocystis]MCY0995333.1 hypothetical protein [Nannocystis sp. ILAH1]MCY1065158.1 hypothetical protein [Nannocystis sp. RBIL2]